MLAKAHNDGTLDKQLTILSRPTLLIIDAWDICPSKRMRLICSSNWPPGATKRARF
ncbi:hypothetical protein SAMN05216228_10779 [Rhizobium tibeticum]|uniref:Uncharacterized protein n=1 Tax=Rhizobium tibeticum TaxID=501024 RepID=A0A1H8WT09_9HYPH|nr:hypothetical protein RTCCBAU85039_6632 [Rhizobium tibeticum]SEP30805.1 hypothetical protein SAMN05216228_10779 [Rhizobium tibeticum]